MSNRMLHNDTYWGDAHSISEASCNWHMVMHISSSEQDHHLLRWVINSLTLRGFEWNFKEGDFQANFDDWWFRFLLFKLPSGWMSLDLTHDMSTLVQVMVWCHQATSHYLSQCWPRFVLPYGVIRPQWVNSSNVIWATRTILNEILNQHTKYIFNEILLKLSSATSPILWSGLIMITNVSHKSRG